MTELTWSTSSYSSKYQACVEVALSGQHTYVRDSKDRAGAHLAVPSARWRDFLTALRSENPGNAG